MSPRDRDEAAEREAELRGAVERLRREKADAEARAQGVDLARMRVSRGWGDRWRGRRHEGSRENEGATQGVGKGVGWTHDRPGGPVAEVRKECREEGAGIEVGHAATHLSCACCSCHVLLLVVLLVVVQEEDALVAQVQEQMRAMAAQHAAAVEELQSKLKW